MITTEIGLKRMDNIPVVAIRASDNCFLDVLHCFAQGNVPVIPVVFSWAGATEWISERSAFFHDPVRIVNPAEDEDTAAEQLGQLGRQLLAQYGRKIMLIATSDTALVFVNRHYDTLKKYYLQPGAPDFDKSCWNALRKDTFYQTMEENGVPIPLTRPVNEKADVDRAVEDMVYPCVYKPSLKTIDNAFQRTHDGKKAVECHTAAELRGKLMQELEAGFEVVVQEKIEFDRPEEEVSCYLYADAQGRIRMISAQHKMMEFPARYGTGVVSRTFFSEDMSALAVKTIKALRWHGFLGVELMFSKKHQQWVVIEANLRPWLSNYFQAAAGFNYLLMLYQDAVGRLEPFTETKRPNGEVLYRVNLTQMVKKCVCEGTSTDEALEIVEDFIRGRQGHIVFTYAVPGDPAPGRYEISLLREYYADCDDAFDRIEGLIFGEDSSDKEKRFEYQGKIPVLEKSFR